VGNREREREMVQEKSQKRLLPSQECGKLTSWNYVLS